MGRALAVAQNLEHNGRFVLRIALLSDAHRKDKADTLDGLLDLVNAQVNSRQTLGRVVKGFAGLPEVTIGQREVLERGARARNFIAHEAAAGLAESREAERRERLAAFRAAVVDLAAADNLMSCWSYQLQEKIATAADQGELRQEGGAVGDGGSNTGWR